VVEPLVVTRPTGHRGTTAEGFEEALTRVAGTQEVIAGSIAVE